MSHNWSCANAKLHECHCGGCGGAEHGWQGRLVRAREWTAEDRARLRAGIDAEWDQNRPRTAKGRPGRPNKNRRAAAADSAIADVVDWLAEHPDEIDLIQAVGDLLAKDVSEELEKELGKAKWKALKRSLVDHFWCDLLAALAGALGEFKKMADQIPEYIEKMILESRAVEKRSAVDKWLVRLAVRTVWNLIKRLPVFGQFDDLVRAVRILAILLCPALEDHPAVYHHCIVPLVGEGVKEIISDETKRRLEEIFPEDWPDGIRRKLAG